MDWMEYCERTGDTAVYPPEHRLEYLSLKLAGESGEVADLVGKRLRGDYDDNPAAFYEKLYKELGDVAWYLGQLSWHFAPEVLERNLEKLADRKRRGVLKGSGSDR